MTISPHGLRWEDPYFQIPNMLRWYRVSRKFSLQDVAERIYNVNSFDIVPITLLGYVSEIDNGVQTRLRNALWKDAEDISHKVFSLYVQVLNLSEDELNPLNSLINQINPDFEFYTPSDKNPSN